jgi:hypothetical protein
VARLCAIWQISKVYARWGYPADPRLSEIWQNEVEIVYFPFPSCSAGTCGPPRISKSAPQGERTTLLHRPRRACRARVARPENRRAPHNGARYTPKEGDRNGLLHTACPTSTLRLGALAGFGKWRASSQHEGIPPTHALGEFGKSRGFSRRLHFRHVLPSSTEAIRAPSDIARTP